jgi:hypothetical protein
MSVGSDGLVQRGGGGGRAGEREGGEREGEREAEEKAVARLRQAQVRSLSG